MKKKGFTLIELMIVVAIIGILAAIAIPNMVYTKKKAKLAACESNLKNLAQALDMYAGDNDDQYPQGAGQNIGQAAGILITGGYLQKVVACPVGAGAAYTFDCTIDSYTIDCPTPANHYWSPKKTIATLRYLSQGGIEKVKNP